MYDENNTDIFTNDNIYIDKKYYSSYSNNEPENTIEFEDSNTIIPKFNNKETIHIEKKVTVFDVSSYILSKLGTISTMKLQKLVYYSQAWSLVWDEEPLFSEEIEAWANGPVIPKLFAYHRRLYKLSKVTIGNIDNLNDKQKETIDAVIDFYGNKSAQWLIDLSHSENPWQQSRKGMPDTERGNRVINIESIQEYYSSL